MKEIHFEKVLIGGVKGKRRHQALIGEDELCQESSTLSFYGALTVDSA